MWTDHVAFLNKWFVMSYQETEENSGRAVEMSRSGINLLLAGVTPWKRSRWAEDYKKDKEPRIPIFSISTFNIPQWHPLPSLSLRSSHLLPSPCPPPAMSMAPEAQLLQVGTQKWKTSVPYPMSCSAATVSPSPA